MKITSFVDVSDINKYISFIQDKYKTFQELYKLYDDISSIETSTSINEDLEIYRETKTLPEFKTSKQLENSLQKECILESIKIIIDRQDYTSEDIIALFKSLELDQAQLNKLFNRVNNFSSYRPIRQEVNKAGWNEKIRKKFAKEIQDLINEYNVQK